MYFKAILYVNRVKKAKKHILFDVYINDNMYLNRTVAAQVRGEGSKQIAFLRHKRYNRLAANKSKGRV